jgi:hypothetical protein
MLTSVDRRESFAQSVIIGTDFTLSSCAIGSEALKLSVAKTQFDTHHKNTVDSTRLSWHTSNKPPTPEVIADDGDSVTVEGDTHRIDKTTLWGRGAGATSSHSFFSNKGEGKPRVSDREAQPSTPSQ